MSVIFKNHYDPILNVVSKYVASHYISADLNPRFITIKGLEKLGIKLQDIQEKHLGLFSFYFYNVNDEFYYLNICPRDDDVGLVPSVVQLKRGTVTNLLFFFLSSSIFSLNV